MTAGRILVAVALVHLAVGVVAAALLATGRTDALKPLKFGISIALFLGSMAVLVPMLRASAAVQLGLALALALTMVAETVPIVVQALRGQPSHFNTATTVDAVMWRVMAGAIVVATVAMVAVAVLATARPLLDDGRPLEPLRATAWRVGGWLLLAAALSGFAMGSRLRHGVGPLADGAEAGVRLVGWSKTQGDLRVPHFVALHAFQAVQLAGAVLHRLAIPVEWRWGGLILVALVFAALAGWTLLTALAGRPLLSL